VKCLRCGRDNPGLCRCDPNNLPTRAPVDKIVPKSSWVDKPYDTHVAWGALDGWYGEFVWSRYGITEEKVFVQYRKEGAS
jgi:hypothetical protein